MAMLVLFQDDVIVSGNTWLPKMQGGFLMRLQNARSSEQKNLLRALLLEGSCNKCAPTLNSSTQRSERYL